jgi:predicted transposase/invertase (TIGR01784 family)
MDCQKSVSNPHDQFFRMAFKDKRVAHHFLKTWLPSALRQEIDFEQLQLQPRHYTNAVRKESVIDVLFRTQIRGRDAYLYVLLEHQSTPDVLMPFRLFQYMCTVMDNHLNVHKTKKIPLVYPIVVYHGKRPYPHSMNLRDLVDAPEDLVSQYFLKPFQLIDLGQIDDETLKQHAWSGVMEFVLKHIYERDIVPYIQQIAPILHELSAHDGEEYTQVVLQYVIGSGEVPDKNAFFKLIDSEVSQKIGDKIMTLAEQLKEEGKMEGKLEGKLEAVKLMLKEGTNLLFIQKVTGLPLELIQNLSKSTEV